MDFSNAPTVREFAPTLFATSLTGCTQWPFFPCWYFLNGEERFCREAEQAYIDAGSPGITEKFCFRRGSLTVEFRHRPSEGNHWVEVSDGSPHQRGE